MQESIQLVIDSLPFLLKGAGYTLQLSIGGMFFGLLLGFILTLMRLSPIWPVRWLARGFAARYNFNDDKIIMEYREPLPAGIESLSALPLGAADTLRAFEQRARETFSVGPVPSDLSQLRQGYAQGVQWQYMDENFLGTVSKYDFFNAN